MPQSNERCGYSCRLPKGGTERIPEGQYGTIVIGTDGLGLIHTALLAYASICACCHGGLMIKVKVPGPHTHSSGWSVDCIGVELRVRVKSSLVTPRTRSMDDAQESRTVAR